MLIAPICIVIQTFCLSTYAKEGLFSLQKTIKIKISSQSDTLYNIFYNTKWIKVWIKVSNPNQTSYINNSQIICWLIQAYTKTHEYRCGDNWPRWRAQIFIWRDISCTFMGAWYFVWIYNLNKNFETLVGWKIQKLYIFNIIFVTSAVLLQDIVDTGFKLVKQAWSLVLEDQEWGSQCTLAYTR